MLNSGDAQQSAEKETSPAHAVQAPEQQEAGNEPTGRQLRGVRWVLIVLSILTSTFLFGLDNTITADVQPAIVGHFGSVDRLAWISVAFLVGAASTTLFWLVKADSSGLYLSV